MEYPLWAWLTFFVTVLAALAVDLGIANRNAHAPTRRETIVWSVVWVSLALLFNGFIYWMVNNHFGDHALALTKGKEFFTGYLIELSLSIDNLFVFLLIFGFFKVPKKYQHRALFWGIFMALILRMVMIFAGAEIVERFEWILYFFGAFLVYTGIKMLSDDSDFNPEESAIVRLTTRFVPITKTYDGENFFTEIDGKKTGTLLLLVLIVINVADLVFAVDSIPAIFGITTDKFIVYTSNIFAILGLRTFYFLLVEMAEKFHLLKYGLAFVLSFIGVKMLLPLIAQGIAWLIGADGARDGLAGFLYKYLHHEYEQTIVNLSLGIVVAAISLSVVASLIFPPPASEA